MFNILKKDIPSKKIVNEYLNREDNKNLMFIFLGFSILLLFIIFFYELPLILHALTLTNFLIALFIYIRLNLYKNVEQAFHLLFPQYNNKTEYLFELIFTIAETENIDEKNFVKFVNNKYEEMKKYYINTND